MWVGKAFKVTVLTISEPGGFGYLQSKILPDTFPPLFQLSGLWLLVHEQPTHDCLPMAMFLSLTALSFH